MDSFFKQHFTKARELVTQNKLNEALESINKCLEITPEHPDALSQRGVIYFHLKKEDLALMDMDRAVTLDASNAYRYSSRAYIRAAYKDIEGAESDYLKAIELDPKDEIAYNNYGLLLENRGHVELAKKHYTKADQLAGIKPIEQRAKEARDKSEESKAKPEEAQHSVDDKQSIPEQENSAMSTTIKSVFTKKSVFKEFVTFLKNGFKLP
jgi:Tfp pilus assembly protein PilF